MRNTATTELLHAILVNPVDDGPRLAYADAIEAEDPDRAELIRLMVVLGSVKHNHRAIDHGGNPDGCPSCKARARYNHKSLHEVGLRVRTDFSTAWLADGVRVPSGSREAYRRGHMAGRMIAMLRDPLYTWLSRGFVDRIAIHTDAFMEFGPDLFKFQPITGVLLEDREPFDTGTPPRELMPHIPVGPGYLSLRSSLSIACVNWARDKAGLQALERSYLTQVQRRR